MTKTHFFQRCIAASFALVLLLAAPSAQAKWPSWEEAVEVLRPLVGLDNDQTEATIFAIKHPVCAGTIVSYTLAQDYSLVGFIGALKVTKLQSIPKLLPINGGNCKSYQPIQQAYQFIDRKGDEYLGKSKADYLRTLLASQIEEGKSFVDAEVASIPYLGTILANWDCECDAAFDSNFKTEKLADQIVGTVISIVKSIKDGNYGTALETMITTLGPDMACKLAEQYSGIGSIPIVSDVASAACAKIAGKVIGWVVSGTGAAAEALGIIGGDHIPPENYYNQMFVPMLGKDGYVQLADTLYNNCYDYFEPTNMSSSTAKKVCALFRDRYVVQSMGKLQWHAFQIERGEYYKKNVRPKAEGAALVSDAAFKNIKEDVRTACKQYFLQQYPQANIFTAAFNDEPIETVCDGFVSYSPSSYHPWDMDKARNTIQKNLTYAMAGKTGGLCNADPALRNLIKCQDGQGMNACTQSYPKACANSSLELGGKEIPCCQGGAKPSESEQMAINVAAEIAKKSGGPFCTTSPTDPLKIVCSLPQAYKACQSHFSWMNQRECDPKAVTDLGQATTTCCSFDASALDKVDGITPIKSFVASHAKDTSSACSAGGYSVDKLLSYDPRIVACGSTDNIGACKNTFGSDACKIGDGGFVTKPCCVTAVFGGGSEYVDTYDPSQRTPEQLAKAKKLVDDSKGDCTFGTALDGKPDLFRVVCKTPASLKACVKEAGQGTDSRAKCHLTKSGYVQTPCCAPDASLYYADYGKLKEQEQKNIQKGLVGKKGLGVKGGESLKPAGSVNTNDGDMYKPADDKKASPNAGDLGKALGDGNLKDKLGQGTKHLEEKSPAKPKRAGGDKRAVSDKDNELVAIRLLKAKPLSGASPFTAGDVRTKIDPSALDKGGVAKTGKTLPGASEPANDNHVPSSPSMRGPAAGVVSGAASGAGLRTTSGGFSCTGKSNGDYCSNSTTLVTCTGGAQSNATLCEGGCNSAARACNPYKP